jgi:hypothetical protein
MKVTMIINQLQKLKNHTAGNQATMIPKVGNQATRVEAIPAVPILDLDQDHPKGEDTIPVGLGNKGVGCRKG